MNKILSSEVLISVCVLTYNQKDFIAQCLDSVLMQETNFPYEIILGEDESSDGTREICIEYQKKFPEKIRLFLRSRKDVIYVGGSPTGRYNYLECAKAAKGKYFAFCEGDDYWTDPHKLQKQVDFLEANPDYTICFHAVNILTNGVERSSDLFHAETEKSFTIHDLAKGNMMHTASVVYRNGLIENFPEWFNQSPVGDYVLHLLNAKKGLIKYLPDTMAVYRAHPGGVWSHKHFSEIFPKWIWLMNKLLDEDFDEISKQGFMEQKQEMIRNYIQLAFRENQMELITKFFQQLFSSGDAEGIDIGIQTLLQHIKSSEKHIDNIQQTRTYRFIKKISGYKSRLLGN